MINIKSFIFNPFQVNTYVLSDESNECILVDTVQNLRKLAKYRRQPPPKRRITTPEI